MIDLDKPTTVKEIINNNIYGGWILKDRIIPVYGVENHAEAAYEIIEKILKLYPNSLIKPNRKYSIYRIMYRLGFIRLSVYNYKDEITIDLEYSKYLVPNEYQQRLIARADELYPVEIYYKERKNEILEIERI